MKLGRWTRIDGGVGRGNRLVPFLRILGSFPWFRPGILAAKSVEDAIIAVVDAGRIVFTSCVPVEKPNCPGSRNAHTWLFEDQENDTVPTTLPVPGEPSDDGDWPF